jgi:hypothetical protein
MTNRLQEQGVLANGGQLGPLGPLGHAFNENKDLLSQYKSDAFRETSSASSAHRVSPRATASPGSSDGSVGGALSSPYPSLFDPTPKGNGFAARYGSTSPSYIDSRKEVSNHLRFHASGLPLSPVSPLSPLSAATAARFLFHNSNAGALFGKAVNGLHAIHGMSKLYGNGDLNFAAYQSSLLPIHALQPVLKASGKEPDINQNIGECYADVPEQDRPIDLSVKGGPALSEHSLKALSKSSKHSVGDHDSGFSPSSNEDNTHVNTSPLDLTSKRTPDPPIDKPNEDHSDSDNDDEEHMESSEDK